MDEFYTVEPETIAWIDGMAPGELLFDVGANIGCYSLYAAAHGLNVVAFEPAAANFAALEENVRRNGLPVEAHALAVTDKDGLGTLYLSRRDAGAALHSFGRAVNYHGKPLRFRHTQKAIGVTLDSFVRDHGRQPDHIKIDVDGNEALVIAGAFEVLRNVQSVLIEIYDTVAEQRNLVEQMLGLGFACDFDAVRVRRINEGPHVGYANHIFVRCAEPQ